MSGKPNCLVCARTSACWVEFGPKIVGTSVLTFSTSMFAVEIPPTSHPARVNGTQGAGATPPVGVTMVGAVSVVLVAVTGSVQYANELAELLVPSVLYTR